jgi:5'(3')-deoxyribonucleotidase
MSKRTIIIDTDNNLVELLQDGYNIIEHTIYDDEIVEDARELLNSILSYVSKDDL